MQFTTVALSFFAALATAQTNSTSETLPDLVAQLPTCAMDCFDSSATSAGCTTTDFECLCTTQSFITNIGACVLLGGTCSNDDISTATDLANKICADVKNNPNPTEVAEASGLVSSALASASPTETPDAAARPDIAFGMVGAGLLAALAL
ncbi:hypothetical protein MGN70_008591 [Eutypa lata]|uniref:Putative immunoreactive protein n=1 Tax=Eutypa lata (strain UCR-EL1) TaxID=1287681 RepID=M7SKK2_EUTLA|nr:putative immunoreactive protein [Eutypa lata UCREL1]KAI1248984.1 hypothetical protein MGN70_008591 [Eutypa lata]